MIEIVKNKIWDLLREKEVSLAVIYDIKGNIIWHKGRESLCKKNYFGDGFCIDKNLENILSLSTIEKENAAAAQPGNCISPSNLRKILIQPLNSHYFLYVNTKTVQYFNKSELIALKETGEILATMIVQMKKNENEVRRISGKSEKIKKVWKLVLDYSCEEEPVLLLGDTGVGKSYIAEVIHYHSGRKGKFVVAGAPNFQENLFETILFGHKKGAFTDAKLDRKGLVEEAIEGTLLIDEISEVPLSLQAKLLRFIDTKKYRVLGESFEREADVRIIAASNKDLLKAIKDKEFREDLYYRLNVLEITIPPLRDRKEDIESFVKEKQNYLRGKEVGSGFMEALYNHPWPGNFRELITVLKRAGIGSKNPITGEDIQNIINKTNCDKILEKENTKIEQIWDALKAGKTFWDVVKRPFLDRELNRSEVKSVILEGLNVVGGKYKNLIKLFNIQEDDYKKFIKFLNGNRLN